MILLICKDWNSFPFLLQSNYTGEPSPVQKDWIEYFSLYWWCLCHQAHNLKTGSFINRDKPSLMELYLICTCIFKRRLTQYDVITFTPVQLYTVLAWPPNVIWYGSDPCFDLLDSFLVMDFVRCYMSNWCSILGYSSLSTFCIPTWLSVAATSTCNPASSNQSRVLLNPTFSIATELVVSLTCTRAVARILCVGMFIMV